jgi:hypothetical protein
VAVEEPAGPALWRAVPPGPGAPGSTGLPGDPHRRDPDRLPVPVPVDQRGARTGAVPPSCRSLVVTPDAHDPLGHILSAGRHPQIVQRAAADLFADGAVVRMMHRLGRLHLGGRRLVEASLGGLVRLGGLDAVGTAVVHLPGGSDPGRVVTALRERGVLVAR